MFARGSARGFELFEQRLRNHDAGHFVMQAQGLLVTAQWPQTNQDGNRRFTSQAIQKLFPVIGIKYRLGHGEVRARFNLQVKPA